MPEELVGKDIKISHLMKVCKYRQGDECCKYVVYFEDPDDFFCVKNILHLRYKLDNTQMEAKGDNCVGL